MVFMIIIIGLADGPPTKRPYPANQAQVYRELLHQRGPPLLINAKCTEPYYTEPVEPIVK